MVDNRWLTLSFVIVSLEEGHQAETSDVERMYLEKFYME